MFKRKRLKGARMGGMARWRGYRRRSGGLSKNVCIAQPGTDGTWYLYDSSVPYGVATPDRLNDDTFFYAFRCKDTGEWELKFGDLGETKLTDIDRILIRGTEDASVADWDATAKCYIFNDVPQATKTIQLINDGAIRLCLGMYMLPAGPVIEYDFVLERGTRP